MTSRRKTNSVGSSILAIDREVSANTNGQWHGLLVDIIILGVLLDCFGDVINCSLVSLTANDSVLIWRVVGKALEEVRLLLQGIHLNSFAERLLNSQC